MTSILSRDHWKKTTAHRSFWLLLVGLIGAALLHNLTPPSAYSIPWQTIERILFLPFVSVAAFAFGRETGFVALCVAVLSMLPHVFLTSPFPVDALVEMVTITVVGGLVVWMLDAKKLDEGPQKPHLRDMSRLKMISGVTAALTQSFDLEHTLDDILNRVLEVLGVEAGAVYLLNEEEQGLTLVAYRKLPTEVVEEANGLKSARMLARHKDLECKLAGPLRSKGRINGLLFAGGRTSCPILRQEKELLNTICNTTGMFVENVRLYQERARQLQIERSVYEVVKEVTSELELDRVLLKVTQIAVRLLGADGGVMALLDGERNAITYPYLHRLPSELAAVTVSKGEGLSGEVMTTGRPKVIDDYKAYPEAVPTFVEAGLTSVVAVPVVSGERTFGALSALSINQTRGFSDRDVAILTAIGRQAGIAIENAYLYENMRFYARRIMQAQEDERKRIARELHDDTIQSLIGLSRRLEVLASNNGLLSEAAAHYVGGLLEATGDMVKRVRRFSQDLRPPILDHLGLLPALEELTETLNRQDGLQAEFEVIGEERRFSSEIELTLFRIVQEALNNIRRHAQASCAAIRVELSDSLVHMTVRDDGRGFEVPTLAEHPAPSGKLGLIGMQERARLLGGSLVVHSAPGVGTKVIVKAPV